MNTRVLIAIIGVLVVLVGTGAGVYLVRQQQILKEKASGLTACGDTISPPTCVGKSNGSSCDISSPNDGICGGAPNCFCLLKTQISEGGTSSGGSSGPTSTTATSTLPPACSGSCSTSGGCPSGTTFTLDQSCPNVNGAHIRCCTGSSISTVVYNQCGGGLSCSATQLNGLMFPCLNGSSLVYCCPSGQIIDTGVFGATNTCHIVNSNSSGVTTVATNTLPKATNPPGWQACGSCSCVQAGVGERGNECQINDKGKCVW